MWKKLKIYQLKVADFLKANRTLIKLNFLFHLKSNTNLVNLRKCNSQQQC